MFFSKSLKFIREKRHIPQNKMLLAKDSSQYSRIENGKASLKVDTLVELVERLGLSINEFVQFSSIDTESQKLSKEINFCIDNPDLEYQKQELIKKYKQFEKLPKKQKTLEKTAYYFAIKCMLSRYWKEIPSPTNDEITQVFNTLINSDFYGQFDYLLAVNMIPYFNKLQIDTITTRMYPLEFPEKRTDQIKNYADLLIVNAISLRTYAMDYQTAYNYVLLAQKHTKIKENYYLHLNLLYHKNNLLRFIEKDTKYIEKARKVIQTIADIGDKKTADTFLEELNKLTEDPAYYNNTQDIPTVSIHK
ncbi:helix-turn-helix domain-containing protein [Enterococcus sp. AZ126]|uniref:helix-turn-helix domain-containing protein n=1 Tax=Enterococcus sp. AZ126 TaxID=2774635 RepID=UPI003F1E9265